MADWRMVWTVRRVRLWVSMAAIAAWLPLLGISARGWLDFSAFYAAGALAFEPQVLDLASVASFQEAHRLPNTPFLYPPTLAIVYAPLATLPYELAAALHLVAQAAFLLAAAVLGGHVFGIPRRWAVVGTLAWSPAAAAVISGQNSAVLLLLTIVSAWALVRGSGGHLLAGFAIGFATYRPHLGLPLLGLALWRRVWYALAVATATIAIQYTLGAVATGGQLDWPARWLSTIAAETANDFHSIGWQAVGLPGILGRLSVGGSALGSPVGPALIGYLVGLLLIVSALGSLRRWDAPRAVALTCALALFAGPRGFVYDGTMLLPAIAILARDGAARGWPWGYRWLLASGYGLALIWPLGGVVGVNPLAIVVLLMPFVLLGRGPFRTFGPAPPGLVSHARAVPLGILGRP